MNQAEQPQSTASSWRRSFLVTLIVLILGLLAWWFFMGTGKQMLSDIWPFGQDPPPAVPELAPQAAPTGSPDELRQRLENLEALAMALQSSGEALESRIASLDELARSEDLRASVARLRGEIRGVRESFPEGADLVKSQINLSWHLLQLAEMEYRLFGDVEAVLALLGRIGNLLGENAEAIDILVDLRTLAQEIQASRNLTLLEQLDELRAIEQLAAQMQLAPSEFHIDSTAPAGFVSRLWAGVRSLARIERRSSFDEIREIHRLELLLMCQRMQVAVLRRDAASLQGERDLAINWIERHAQSDDARTQELLSRLHALQALAVKLASVDFATPLARLADMAGRE